MQIARRLALVLMLVLGGCGGDSNPASPSSRSGSGSGGSSGGGGGGGGTGPSQSSVTATIDGQPYNATEILAPDPDFAGSVSGLNVPRLVNVATGDRPRGWGFAFAAPAVVGTHSISELGVSANLQQVTPGYEGEIPAGSPAWFALSPVGGSGSVTITTLTETTATGTFSFTVVPNPATAATGNKTVSGSFSLTFMDQIQL